MRVGLRNFRSSFLKINFRKDRSRNRPGQGALCGTGRCGTLVGTTRMCPGDKGGRGRGSVGPRDNPPHLNKVVQSSRDDGTRPRSHDQLGTEPGSPRLSPGEARSWGTKGGTPILMSLWISSPKIAGRRLKTLSGMGRASSRGTEPSSPQAPASHRRMLERLRECRGATVPSPGEQRQGCGGEALDTWRQLVRSRTHRPPPHELPSRYVSMKPVAPPRDETCQLPFPCLTWPESPAGATRPSPASASRSPAPRPRASEASPAVSRAGTFKFERALKSPGSSDNAGCDSTGLGPGPTPCNSNKLPAGPGACETARLCRTHSLSPRTAPLERTRLPAGRF